MRLSKRRRSLLIKLELIVGSACRNESSRRGPYEYGQEIRYPVTVMVKRPARSRYRNERSVKVVTDDISDEALLSGRYRFGANELYVFKALSRILDYLEKCYGFRVEQPPRIGSRNDEQSGRRRSTAKARDRPSSASSGTRLPETMPISSDEKVLEDSMRELEAERLHRITHYSDAIRLNDHDWEAWYELGKAHASAFDHELALSAYGRVAEINPEYWEVWLNIGHVRARAGQDVEAISAFGRAIERAPDFETAYGHLGDHGQSGSAVRAFMEAARQLGSPKPS